MQDLRQGDQERGMRRLQQAIRKVHLQEEIGEFQAERDHKSTTTKVLSPPPLPDATKTSGGGMV